jgi:DNA polymerase III gamma/tau subunit
MLLPTIRSRCQILKFRSLPVKQIETNILNYFNFDKIKVRIAAQLSQGCILKALEYVNTNIMDFRKIVITKFSSVMEMKRFFEFHNFINELIEIQRKFKVEINNDSIVSNYDYDLKLIILELILSYLRDLFFWKVLNIENKILNSDFIEQIKEISEKYNEIELKKFIDNLFCSFRLMNNNVRDFLLYENIFL